MQITDSPSCTSVSSNTVCFCRMAQAWWTTLGPLKPWNLTGIQCAVYFLLIVTLLHTDLEALRVPLCVRSRHDVHQACSCGVYCVGGAVNLFVRFKNFPGNTLKENISAMHTECHSHTATKPLLGVLSVKLFNSTVKSTVGSSDEVYRLLGRSTDAREDAWRLRLCPTPTVGAN